MQLVGEASGSAKASVEAARLPWHGIIPLRECYIDLVQHTASSHKAMSMSMCPTVHNASHLDIQK